MKKKGLNNFGMLGLMPMVFGLLGLLGISAIADAAATLPAPAQSGGLSYEARMGPLVAGDLDLSVVHQGEGYGIYGRFLTSQALNAYYNWEGTFVANGRWSDTGPQTRSYLVVSESKEEEYKVVVMNENGSQRLEGREGEFETLPKPNGMDLISGLMFTPQCYTGDFVHDGEDTYPIKLVQTRQGKLSKRRGFFSGPVVRCDYEVTTRRGKKRRLRVSMIQRSGMWIAAEIRVRLALFPDPVFRLRT